MKVEIPNYFLCDILIIYCSLQMNELSVANFKYSNELFETH